MALIQRRGKLVRPTWNYLSDVNNTDNSTSILDQLEMTESIRNTLEQIRDSQMLQCEIASAIKDIAKQVRGLRQDLKAQKRR